MRVETMVNNVILRLQAIDRMGVEHGGGSETMRVPSTSGRRELRIRTGMFFSIAAGRRFSPATGARASLRNDRAVG